MGDFTMTIVGSGPVHNRKTKEGTEYSYILGPDGTFESRTPEIDADKLFHAFKRQLSAAGHSIAHASFTHGGRE